MAIDVQKTDWMDDLYWLRCRVRALRKLILEEPNSERYIDHERGTQLARRDALAIFEQRISDLEAKDGR